MEINYLGTLDTNLNKGQIFRYKMTLKYDNEQRRENMN